MCRDEQRDSGLESHHSSMRWARLRCTSVPSAQDAADAALRDEFPEALTASLRSQVGDVGLDDGDFAVPVVFPDVVEDLHLGRRALR